MVLRNQQNDAGSKSVRKTSLTANNKMHQECLFYLFTEKDLFPTPAVFPKDFLFNGYDVLYQYFFFFDVNGNGS